MLKSAKKGIVLFVVLMTVILVIVLGNIILGVMFGQNRFTHHKVSRIQAYYACLAGIRYASEMIRTHVTDWIPNPDDSTGTEVSGRICRSPADCTPPNPKNDVIDAPSGPPYNFPGTTNVVNITVYPLNKCLPSGKCPPNGTRIILASVNYADQ